MELKETQTRKLSRLQGRLANYRDGRDDLENGSKEEFDSSVPLEPIQPPTDAVGDGSPSSAAPAACNRSLESPRETLDEQGGVGVIFEVVPRLQCEHQEAGANASDAETRDLVVGGLVPGSSAHRCGIIQVLLFRWSTRE